ncbi:MAG: CDP-alcohol phosphatidyltransferase family protein [Candidatus Contendobacter sp.]|nr:CDP-alcohol phosphatidyltransferase family protein [Candidatus Contendobacter sp.]MDS4060741.1 CDP-alcohol phosphatidyltransferase family protein [Candidatus Contendobacter sp.]
MNLLTASPLRPLIFSALIHVASVLPLVAGLAWTLAETFQLSAGYVLQTLAVFAGLLLVLLPFLPQHRPLQRFGAANDVTLLRAGIAALAAGLIGQTEPPSGLAWTLAVLTGIALILDGVDGWLARRGGWQSPFGARFDMEVDAFLILVLAALVHQADKAGGWVLLSGALRYGFVALGYALPWLRQPLPPRRRRQTVCVIQTAVLILCLLPPLVPPWTPLLSAGALALLTLSFTVDTVWLARHAPPAR